jgi:beta-xylosidase
MGTTRLLQLVGRMLPMMLLLFCAAGCAQQGPSAINHTTGTTMKTFQNPVLQSDFPDPSIIRVRNTFYAYATNAAGKNIQAARSTDLVNWEMLPDALPALPSWAQLGGSFVWAPDVIQIGDTFVMYYTARDAETNVQCIGVATSSSPDGKFKDTSSRPLVCQSDLGGTIDATPFRDGDKLYLYFKNDGNSRGLTTSIWAQELSPDGLSVVDKPTQLIHNDKPWEGSVVEAPNMFKHDNQYYLFFSANNYADQTYAVGYATCQSPMGPCTQAPENPILASRLTQPFVIGPGGQTVFQLGDQTWILYHAWDMDGSGQRGDSRNMWLDRVTWKDGKPHIEGPTTGPQPMPLIPAQDQQHPFR